LAGVVELMPLPDAKPDRRIYELLKTTDLENLTFSDFQKVAQTIYAEQGAEDELRRIVLVNLARLSVAGEWTGLTSAGGGSFNPIIPQVGTITATTRYQLWGNIPYNGANFSANQTLTDFDKPRAYPFVAPASGNVSEVGMKVNASTSSADALVAFYNSDENTGQPKTLLGSAVIAMGSTGEIYQTSTSATITLEAGKQYYYAILWDGATATGGTLDCCDGDNSSPIGISSSVGSGQMCFRHDTATTSAPTTFSPDRTVSTSRIKVSIKVS
jgi:hypothetical protein